MLAAPRTPPLTTPILMQRKCYQNRLTIYSCNGSLIKGNMEQTTVISSDGDSLDTVQLRSVQMTDLLSTYYQAVETLLELFSLSPYFDPVIYGPGSDGIQIPVEIIGGNSLYCCHHEPQILAIYVLRQAAVLQNGVGLSAGDMKQNTIVLYSSDLSATGKDTVRLHLSSRTYELLGCNDYGLSLSDCTLVTSDDRGTPQFCLSSVRMLEAFRREVHSNLVLHHRERLARLSPEPRSVLSRHDDIASELCLVTMTPGLRLFGWPDAAHGWLCRNRQHAWPPRSLREDIAREPIYLIPGCSQRIVKNSDSEHDWVFCFRRAESKLFEKINETQKYVYRVLTNRLRDMTHDLLPENVVKAAFLWTLEEQPTTYWNKGNLASCFHTLCFTMQKFIRNRYWPHYFMEDINIISHFDDKDCDIIHKQIKTLTEDLSLLMQTGHSLGYLTEHRELDATSTIYRLQQATLPDADVGLGAAKPASRIVDALNGIERDPVLLDDVRKHVAEALCDSFDQCVRLLHLQHFTALHNRASLQGCIAVHEMALGRMFVSGCQPLERLIPVALRLATHLGSLHCERASLATGRHRAYCVRVAEAYFSTSRLLDASLGATKMALLHFMQNRYGETIDVLTADETAWRRPSVPNGPDYELLMGLQAAVTAAVTAATSRRTAPGVAGFETRLWRRWTALEYVCDAVVSVAELHTVPAFIGRNFSFFCTSIIGMPPRPCAVIDVSFIADLLLSLSYVRTGRRAAARCLLDGMQHAATAATQWDANERRQVACLNCIAAGYLQLGGRQVEDTALRVLDRCRWYVPYPNNVAPFIILEHHLAQIKTTLLWVVSLCVLAVSIIKMTRCVCD